MFLFALASVTGALGVTFAPGTVIAAAALMGMVAANAALFWSFQAPGLAAAQLLAYGSSVALVFHVAYWRSQARASEKAHDRRRYWAALVMVLCFILILRVLGASAWGSALFAMPVSFSLAHALASAAALLALGLFGAMTQRDGIRIGLSLQVALNAVLLNLAAFGHYLHPHATGGVGFTIAAMAVGAAQALVGMGLLRRLFVRCDTMDLEAFDEVRG